MFWAGVHPEALKGLCGENEKDCLLKYCFVGKRAYREAAQTGVDDVADVPLCELLSSLSEQFEMCAYGLREVRREWERRD